jgi:CoA:oxalate CoA-transferase
MSGALAGLVVLDLTQIYNGPYATFMMAAAGAEVIKIEPPGGEHLRRRASHPASRLPQAMLNAGKRSMMIDLKVDAGRELLLRLVETADVLVENFAAGVMERLGLGDEVLHARNPRLIHASSSGYGADGPYRDYPAMDLTMQAMCGIIASTGFPDAPPVKAGPAFCDFQTGVHLYAATVTALLERERTGHVPRVEVSMMESAYFALSSNLGMVHATRDPAGGQTAAARTGNRHGALSLCPYNVYPTADGWIAIIVNHNQHWQQLTEAFGHPELAQDPRYRDNADRVRRMQEVDDRVSEWCRTRTREQVFRLLIDAAVPCAPVRELTEVMDDPHLFARGSLRHVTHPQYGPIVAAASPLRFDGRASLPEPPAEPLGHSTLEVLTHRLGLSGAQIDALRETGAI